MTDERSGNSDYIAARLGDEQRIVLVPFDPERPWVAFRRMRSWMRRSRRNRSGADQAKIIPFRPIDRAR